MRKITLHTYFASSPGIDWNLLVAEAKRDARRVYGGEIADWKLEGMYEYDVEVLDERGKCIDIEARVVVRAVDV
jgi:hypothetical protein